MRNYIELNGVRSTSVRGLIIQQLPPVTKPPVRYTADEIDGRDGDLVKRLGYAAYDRQAVIGLYGDYDLDGAIRFFNSSGTAVFSNEPHYYYRYEILDRIDFERLLRFRQATITFHCQPFKWSCVESALTFRFASTRMTYPADWSDDQTDRFQGQWHAATVKLGANDGYASRVSVTYEAADPLRASPGVTFHVPVSLPHNSWGSSQLDADVTLRVGIRVYSADGMAFRTTLSDSQGNEYQSARGGNGTSFFDIVLDHRDLTFLSLALRTGAPPGIQRGFAMIDVLVLPMPADKPRLRLLNSGNTDAKPEIRVTGTGTIGIVIGNGDGVEVTLPADVPVTLDTQAFNAYDDDGYRRNRCVVGDFRDLFLRPGYNDLFVYGDAGEIVFTNYSRWI